MTYLELIKTLGLSDLIMCFMDEVGFTGKEIAESFGMTEPTVYSAKKRLATLSEGLKAVDNVTAAAKLLNEDNSIQIQVRKDLRNPDIQTVIETFSDSFGTTMSNKYDRFAAKRLIDKYTVEGIVKVIKALRTFSDDQYCPTVNNIRDVEKKWPAVIKYVGNRLKRKEIVE